MIYKCKNLRIFRLPYIRTVLLIYSSFLSSPVFRFIAVSLLTHLGYPVLYVIFHLIHVFYAVYRLSYTLFLFRWLFSISRFSLASRVLYVLPIFYISYYYLHYYFCSFGVFLGRLIFEFTNIN
jgi:hypothetical protein